MRFTTLSWPRQSSRRQLTFFGTWTANVRPRLVVSYRHAAHTSRLLVGKAVPFPTRGSPHVIVHGGAMGPAKPHGDRADAGVRSPAKGSSRTSGNKAGHWCPCPKHHDAGADGIRKTRCRRRFAEALRSRVVRRSAGGGPQWICRGFPTAPATPGWIVGDGCGEPTCRTPTGIARPCARCP